MTSSDDAKIEFTDSEIIKRLSKVNLLLVAYMLSQYGCVFSGTLQEALSVLSEALSGDPEENATL